MFLIVTKLLVLSLIIDKYLIILFILTIESSDPEVEYRVKKGKFNYKKKTHIIELMKPLFLLQAVEFSTYLAIVFVACMLLVCFV